MSTATIKEIEFKGVKLDITSTGRIFTKGGDEVPQRLNNKTGYYYVWIPDAGISSVHRLVCAAFHPVEGMEKMHTDHIDNNKLNNHQSNLRFVSRTENNSKPHARKMKTMNHKRTNRSGQCVMGIKESEVRYWSNGRQCAIALGCSTTLVYYALEGRIGTASGWALEWVSESTAPFIEKKVPRKNRRTTPISIEERRARARMRYAKKQLE